MKLAPFLAAAVALAGMLAAASAPAAAASTRAPSPAGAVRFLSPPGIGPRLAYNPEDDAVTNTSTKWSGWMDEANSGVQLRFVAADFTVPTVKCNAYGAQAAFWVGLDGWTDQTVEQVGVWVDCDLSGPDGPLPQYFSFWEDYPGFANPVGDVSPGDSISMSAYYDKSNDSYYYSLTDPSSPGANISQPSLCSAGYTCHNSTAEVIAEDPDGGPSKGYVLASFGTVNFSNVAVTSLDGTHGTLEGNSLWSAHEIVMEYPGSTVMAQPSARTDGYTAFSDTYKSAG